jgi:hypothetical protein
LEWGKMVYLGMTRGEYIKGIEDALLTQLELVSSSKEEASKLIDSLGIRHLLVKKPEKTVRKKIIVTKRGIPQKKTS